VCQLPAQRWANERCIQNTKLLAKIAFSPGLRLAPAAAKPQHMAATTHLEPICGIPINIVQAAAMDLTPIFGACPAKVSS